MKTKERMDRQHQIHFEWIKRSQADTSCLGMKPKAPTPLLNDKCRTVGSPSTWGKTIDNELRCLLFIIVSSKNHH